MLTELEEGGKRKSDQYWPDKDNITMALDNGVTLEHLTSSYQGTFINRFDSWKLFQAKVQMIVV